MPKIASPRAVVSRGLSHHRRSLHRLCATSLALVVVGCSGDEEPSGEPSASGGALQSSGGQGGAPGTGGAQIPSGGVPGVGAAPGAGGVPGAGGIPGAGGVPAAGGSPGAGGTDPAAGGSGGMEPMPPACDASAAPALERIGLQPVVQGGGLSNVVDAAQPPGSEDWYLVERSGRVMVWTGGAVRPTPFIDVRSEVPLPGGYDERGLLGLAFAPDYATSGKVYIAIIPTSGGNANRDQVLEFTRSAADPFVVDPASRRPILDLEPRGSEPLPNFNLYHNASSVLFGPDGMLYVGLGDGGGQCNSANPGVPQDIASPYGKMLRLDPSAPPPHGAAGNPFAANGDARVLHYGLRNPFRFGFDSMTGDLYIGDVGQWDFDEISLAPSGETGLNFGWPDFEANSSNTCPSAAALRPDSTHTTPIYELVHGAAGGVLNLTVAIVGGRVYRGSAIPALYGAYLFGEYYPNRPMAALYQCNGQTSPVTSIRKVCDPNFPGACFVSQGGAPALAELGAIVEGNDHELYFAANGSTLLKVVPAQ